MAKPTVKKKTESPGKKTAAHPKVSVMVISAIVNLENKKGLSLYAINKYITANYNADPQKLAHHIKKYLKSAVENGQLYKPTGKGATGAFKLSKTKHPKVKPLNSSRKTILKPKKAFIRNKSPVKSTKSGEEADSQKLANNLNSAVEIEEFVQTTENGASGPFNITKRKPPVKPKVPKVKPSEVLNILNPTLKKTLKPKKAFIRNKSPVKSTKSGEEADSQKLANDKISAVEIEKLVQSTESGASGSFNITKLKPRSKPKVPKVKSSELLNISYSTPKRTLKSKKAFNILNESPAESTESSCEEEASADAKLTTKTSMTKKPRVAANTKIGKSNVSLPVKVKKPKKLVTKKVEWSGVLPKEEPSSSTTFVKPKGTPYPKSKKSTKSKKPAVLVATCYLQEISKSQTEVSFT